MAPMAHLLDHQYDSTEEALTYLHNAGWNPSRPKRWFRPYEEFRGSIIYKQDGHYAEDVLVAQLRSDGALTVIPGEPCHLTEMRELPTYVWSSLSHFHRMRRMTAAVNEKLTRCETGLKVKFTHVPRSYPLMRGGTRVADLESPFEALQSEHNPKPLTDGKMDSFRITFVRDQLR